MRILVLLVVLAAGAAALWYLREPQPLVVELHAVGSGPVASIVANTRAGTLKACRRARLSPNAGGQVTHLGVKAGDQVEAGQVLMELWHQDQDAQKKLQEREIATAESRAREACLRADVAGRDAKRIKELKGRKFVSEGELDRALTEAGAGDAACGAARQAVAAARARMQVVQAAIDRTVLKAPFAGVAAEVTAELGEYITPSPIGIPTPPAVDLIDDSCLYVSAPIDEVDAPAVQLGLPARVRLDAFPERQFPAEVRRIAPYVEDSQQQARTVEVEATIVDVEDAALLPGYSADLEIVLRSADDTLRIPAQSLIDGDTVLVYDAAAGTLQQRRVQTGLSSWEWVQVTSGLEAGDRLALNVSREGVVPGARVVPAGGAAHAVAAP